MILEHINFSQFLPDIFNCLLILFGTNYFCQRYQINNNIFIFLCISLLSPFFFYWLWPWTFLPDQSKYSDAVYNLRNFNFNEPISILFSSRVYLSSLLLAAFPIPFVSTIISIAIINKGILYLVILNFLRTKKHNLLVFLLLFSPSMIVISSVALRDMLVIAVGIFFFYFSLEKKNYKITTIFGILLLLVKPHLGIILCGIAISYYIFFEKFSRKKINIFFFIIGLPLSIFILTFFIQDTFIEIRKGFLLEEFGYRLNKNNDQSNIISLIPIYFINFIISPLLVKELNLINLIIILENLFIIIIVAFLITIIYKENKNKSIFWINVWFFIFLLHSYLFINPGTIWRYKFTIQIILLCATYFSLKNKKKVINFLI